MNKTLFVYTDGASDQIGEVAGMGILFIYDGAAVRYALGDFDKTNNQAEYGAVIVALNEAPGVIKRFQREGYLSGNPSRMVIRTDSQLVVRQIEGLYKVKHPNMRPLHRRVLELVEGYTFPVEFEHVMREMNEEADALSKEGMAAAVKSRLESPPDIEAEVNKTIRVVENLG